MLTKSQTVRRVAVIGAAAALLGSLSVTSASARSAAPLSSGGGCSGYVSIGYGMSVDSCVSASGGTVYPDGYVSGSASNCTIYVDLIDNGSVVSESANSCSGGHVTGYPVGGSGTFFTGIYAVVNGSYTNEVVSPNLYN